MHHHGILRGKSVFSPDALIDFLCGKHSSQIAHQKFHDFGLGRRQAHRLSVHIQRALSDVIAQPAVFQLVLPCAGMDIPKACVTPQLAFHPR